MDKDLSALLDAIVWAHRIVSVDDHTFVFRPLTLEERNLANYIYETQLKKASKKGTKAKQELTEIAIRKGIWKSSYDNDIEILRKELDERLEEYEKERKANEKRRKLSTKLKRLTARLTYLKETIEQIEQTHTQYIELPSAEYHAEYERGLYSLSCATLTFPDKKQKWGTLDNLLKEKDTVLVSNLMRLFYDISIAEEADIRELARSAMWRIKWSGSKKNRGVKTLFDREMYDLTLDQFRLVYWSQIYDSAFESMDPPSDEVVDDDKLFDEWLEEQSEKRKQERKKSAFDKKLTKTGKASNASEVGMMVDGYYCNDCRCGVKSMENRRGHLHVPSCPYGVFIPYGAAVKERKIEDIQSTNPKSVRQLLANEQRVLADAGGDLVPEQELRNDLRTRAQLGLSTNITGPSADDKVKMGRLRR